MIIDCKSISEDIRKSLKQAVETLLEKPTLGLIQVGDDPASTSYVKGKEKAIKECGMEDVYVHYTSDSSEQDIIDMITAMNMQHEINGILVQLPLPDHMDTDKILNAIDPLKDVDCFTPVNVGNLFIGHPLFVPCTPAGIMEILERNCSSLDGKQAVVIGRSNIVGKPIASLLEKRNCTVTLCHSHTTKEELTKYCKNADIIVVATGKPNTLTADMVGLDTIVIDVGINRIPDETKKSGFRLIGDADTENIDKIPGVSITPVPGGVGPMTITMLMRNLLTAYGIQNIGREHTEEE